MVMQDNAKKMFQNLQYVGLSFCTALFDNRLKTQSWKVLKWLMEINNI